MSKKQYLGIIVLTVAITLLVELLFGARLSATLSTLPLIRKWNILHPEAPIVINRRETVRTSDSNDIRDAVDSVKSKLSTIVSLANGQASMTGAAINLSSDGLFLTGKAAVAGDIAKYRVVLQDGTVAPLKQVYFDPVGNLAVLKADVSGVSVANIGASKDASSGQRIMFVYNSLPDSVPQVDPNFVAFPERQGLNQVFDADHPSRSFGVEPASGLVPGEAIVDLGGAVLGMWDGAAVVSSDVFKPAFQQVLAQASAIARSMFGFTYKVIGKGEAALNGSVVGAQVAGIAKNGPAQASGLQAGDIIIKIGDSDVTSDPMFEQLLEKYNSGDNLSLSVQRGKQLVQLTLTVGNLK